VFEHLLHDADLPFSMVWDMDIAKSTTPPYSDKLMLAHIAALNGLGQSNYGLAIASSMRADITATFARLNAEILVYAEDGANRLPPACNQR